MANKPLDKMTKPELVKALKAAQKRIAKLETVRSDVMPPPYDVVHVTQGPDTTSELCVTDPENCGCSDVVHEARSAAEVIESVLPGSMFPWEKK